MKPDPLAREKRWAVITPDNHGWVGRHTDPTEAEISRLAEQLQAQDVASWLAVTEGSYYTNHPMTAVMVRVLSGSGDWEAAWAAFLSRRADALKDGDE
jgi:hypothetical protein